MNLQWAVPKAVPIALAEMLGKRLNDSFAAQKAVMMDVSWIPYLEGITDATGNPDVERAAIELIGQITHAGSLLLWDSDGPPPVSSI